MATIKISGLTAAAAATGTQELEVNESGTSKKITGSQLLSYIEGEISSSPTFTGQVSVADGSVSAPSITNTGDTNTGIFFPAEDTIAFAEGGTEAMRIDSSGNIGIGTSSPGARVHSYSTTTNGATVRAELGGVADGVYFDLKGGVDYRALTATTSAGALDWAIGNYGGGTSGANISFFTGSSGTERMCVDSSGNVGIGTSSPSSILNVSAASPTITLTATTTTGTTLGNKNNRLLLRSNSSTVNNGGEVVFATDDSAVQRWGAISGAIQGNTVNGSYGDLIFGTKASDTASTISERMRITFGGNVGIGTSSPTQKLDVNGAISLSGDGSDVAIYMNGSDAIRNTGTGSIMYLDVAAGSSTQGQFVFRSSNAYTERMRIDSSGNVGIGITPSGSNTGVGYASIQVKTWWLQAAGEYSFNYTNAYDAGSGVKYITSGAATAYTSEQGVHIWQTAPTGTFGNSVTFSERMRIANNGNVGIGTSSPGAKLQIYEPTSAAAQIRVLANGGQQAALQLAGNGTTFGTTSFDIFQDGGSDAYVNNRANASLQFRTNDTERMRITSSGNVGIGTNAPATLCHINGTIRYTNRPAAGTITAIGYDANGDLKNSSSSLRYKHDINDYDKGLDTVLQLRPVTFKFNGETRENSGFIAEEVDALGLNEVMLYDEENRPDGVLYSNMVALLTKAIQEQQAIISDLQARISTLENN